MSSGDELLSMRDALKARLEMERMLGVEMIKTKIPPPESSAPSPTSRRTAPAPHRSRKPSRPASPKKPPASVAPEKAPELTPELEELKQKVSACTKCPLHQSRNHTVFGEGNPRARLMFVGEAPGFNEDKTGRPFVGPAGQLLTKIIEAINLTREEVFIGNILKCRPPGNRNPQPDEILACRGYLEEQIRLIKPEVICTLGSPASKTLLDRPNDGIGKLRGTFHDFDGIPVMPTYHPAYLLRSPHEKRKCWEDMKKVRDLLAEKKA